MVATNTAKAKVSKYHDLNSDEVTNLSKKPNHSISSSIVAMIAVLGFLLVLSLYVCYLRMEMIKMAVVIQENRMEINALSAQLKSFEDTTYNGISPAINKFIQEEVQKSEKARRKRSSNDDYFIGAHLVGTSGRNHRRRFMQSPQPHRYFDWTAESNYRQTLAQMETHHDNQLGSYVVINTEGYYFVYSQVTYRGFGDSEIGHVTVRIGQTSTTVLMTTVNSQQRASAKGGRFNRRKSQDTGFHSGVFYFYLGERVAVMPFNHIGRHEYYTDDTNSFFGLFLISV